VPACKVATERALVNKSPQLVGRPSGFNQDEALNRAMHVFWQKGFEGDPSRSCRRGVEAELRAICRKTRMLPIWPVSSLLLFNK
jgi:hypothetical protein